MLGLDSVRVIENALGTFIGALLSARRLEDSGLSDEDRAEASAILAEAARRLAADPHRNDT